MQHSKITGQNCSRKLPIHNYLNKFQPTILKNCFNLSSGFHLYCTHWCNLCCLVVPPHNIKLYGRKKYQCYLHMELFTTNKKCFLFHHLSPNKFRYVIQLQIILTQLTRATLDSPMQGFMQFTQHNLSVLSTMNF